MTSAHLWEEGEDRVPSQKLKDTLRSHCTVPPTLLDPTITQGLSSALPSPGSLLGLWMRTEPICIPPPPQHWFLLCPEQSSDWPLSLYISTTMRVALFPLGQVPLGERAMPFPPGLVRRVQCELFHNVFQQC